MQRMLDSEELILDVITPYTEHVLPFIRRADGGGYGAVILAALTSSAEQARDGTEKP